MAIHRQQLGNVVESALSRFPFGEPSEIANAAVFLASDEAFTVGAEVLIDVGMSL